MLAMQGLFPEQSEKKNGALGDRAGYRIGLITLIARKTARSGTAPYNPIATERLETVPYNRHYMLAL